MKILKIIYIIALSICAIELSLFLFGAFGGPLGIFYLMKDGMFMAVKGDQVFSIEPQYYPNNNYVNSLQIMNIACTIGYFFSLIGALLSIFLFKQNKSAKYKMGIGLFVASLIFSIVGGAIWRYLVHSHVL